jgi:hypothetical protein
MLPHEELFERLQDVTELNGLIGTTEDLHLDCKIWPQRDEEAQRVLTKALCGFANAEAVSSPSASRRRAVRASMTLT